MKRLKIENQIVVLGENADSKVEILFTGEGKFLVNMENRFAVPILQKSIKSMCDDLASKRAEIKCLQETISVLERSIETIENRKKLVSKVYQEIVSEESE